MIRPDSKFLRRTVAAIGLMAYLVAWFGMVPSGDWLAKRLGAAAGGAYPCMDGACGCMSARQCWTECRCQPLEQKLAWANAHGIEPPAYVDRSMAAADRGAESPACPLCATHDESARVTRPTEPDRSTPCMSATGCRGLNAWITISIVTLPALSAGTPMTPGGGGGCSAPAVSPWRSVALETPEPPPRR